MAQNPNPRQAALSYLNQALAAKGVDVGAADRVFAQEGAGGGIGDSGHAFGPGQFNDAGGVWTGRYPGMSPQQKNQVAWSRPGLDELATRVARVAGGLHGPAAVRSIVSRFERPADIPGEIARALAGYSGGGRKTVPGAVGAMSPPASAPAATQQDPELRRQAVLAMIASIGQPDGAGIQPLVQALQAYRSSSVPAAAAPPVMPADRQHAAGMPPARGGIAELLNEGTGGPTHSTGPHIHAAFTNPQLELAAIRYAQQLGLHVGENPYVGSIPAPGVHAGHSYHYQDFPGTFNGRRLGEAIDVSGPQQAAFYRWLARRR